MARLDRLAPVREVAQIGAAIGREFSYPLLSAVARQPDDRLKEALAESRRAVASDPSSADALAALCGVLRLRRDNEEALQACHRAAEIAPEDPRICYATDSGRVMRTTDGGRTWMPVYSRRAPDGNWTTNGIDVTTLPKSRLRTRNDFSWQSCARYNGCTVTRQPSMPTRSPRTRG